MSETVQERSRMLATAWAKGIYPQRGDVTTLSVGITDEDDHELVLGVCGAAGMDVLGPVLLESLVGERRTAPRWAAITGTCYFDERAFNDPPPPNLETDPTPTTRHGLMVVHVDIDGLHTCIWQVDLDPVIDVPEEPWFESDEEDPGEVEQSGAIPLDLYAFFWALRIVGGEA